MSDSCYKNIYITHPTLGSIKIDIDGKYVPTMKQMCSFCNYTSDNINVRISHMLDNHPDYFFNCDVCDSYVDRSQLIPHMSQHATQYDEDPAPAPAAAAVVVVDELALAKNCKERPVKPASSEEQDDAFSMSSQSNDRFGPLPDSVFEAIKDTEDASGGGGDSQPKTHSQSSEDVSDNMSSRNQSNPRVCPICSKSYRVPSSYFYHMKNFHGGVKQYECNVCGRSFSTKSALTDHVTLHSGEKPYSCPACSKQFRSKASIYIHYNNMHCERKKFPCSLCNRSFKWKQKLLRHIASHTKEKKFMCPKCSQGFGIKGDLTRHMKKHNTVNLLYCDKCGVSFRQKRYLKAHCEKKHAVATA